VLDICNFIYGVRKKVLQYFLKIVAKIYLSRVNPVVIIIAGTANRHWIKENVLEALRKNNISCRGNKKNFNAEIGLPLSILGIDSDTNNDKSRIKRWLNTIQKAMSAALRGGGVRFLVLEMAIDKPNDMKYLLSIIKPEIAVFTAITMIYPENFASLDEIAAEYRKLASALPEKGLAVLNADDERIIGLKDSFNGDVCTYGISNTSGSEYLAKNIEKNSTGQKFVIKKPASDEKFIFIGKFGQHHVYAELVKEIIIDSISAKLQAPKPK
jgi:UDP-N-acetylmuramyl pentapeptide synthase